MGGAGPAVFLGGEAICSVLSIEIQPTHVFNFMFNFIHWCQEI